MSAEEFLIRGRLKAAWVGVLMFLCVFEVSANKTEFVQYSAPINLELKYQETQGDYRIQEWIPPGESLEDWSKMFTLTDAAALHNLDPLVFFEEIGKQWESTCPNFGGRVLYSGMENGYPVAVWYLYCPLNNMTGKPEFTYFKGISGAHGFYTAQFAFAVYSSQMEQPLADEAIDQLKNVSLCDEALPEIHPCQ
jgi:hypothetical protein